MNRYYTKKTSFPKWFILMFSIVVFLLILSAIFNILTPKNRVKTNSLAQKNFDSTQSIFYQLNYSGPDISVPLNFDIVQTQILNKSEQIKNILIKNFGLNQVENFNLWLNNEWSISKNDDRYILSSQDTSSRISKKISNIEAINIAQEFINKYLSSYETSQLNSETEYFSSFEGEPIQASKQAAPIVKIVYGYQVNGFPVIYKNNIENIIAFYIDGNKEIRKVDFSENAIGLKKVASQESLSPNLALQQAIQSNQASIINIGYKSPVLINLNEIKNGDFSSVKIEYRVDPEQQLAYPFYRFKGTVVNKDEQSFQVELITPAIATTPTE